MLISTPCVLQHVYCARAYRVHFVVPQKKKSIGVMWWGWTITTYPTVGRCATQEISDLTAPMGWKTVQLINYGWLHGCGAAAKISSIFSHSTPVTVFSAKKSVQLSDRAKDINFWSITPVFLDFMQISRAPDLYIVSIRFARNVESLPGLKTSCAIKKFFCHQQCDP